EENELLTPSETTTLDELTALAKTYTKVSLNKTVLESHLKELIDAGKGLVELSEESDFHVALPSSAIHSEPVVGKCSACDENAQRIYDAETEAVEAEKDLKVLEVRRKRERLENENREADPPSGHINVRIEDGNDS
ncbi:MAG: hypothetical protein AAGB04_32620, partial [Pseudomonadota bacterium]